MSLLELQNRVITLAIKLNRTDLLSDLQYMTEAQWVAAYYMLLRLQGV